MSGVPKEKFQGLSIPEEFLPLYSLRSCHTPGSKKSHIGILSRVSLCGRPTGWGHKKPKKAGICLLCLKRYWEIVEGKVMERLVGHDTP